MCDQFLDQFLRDWDQFLRDESAVTRPTMTGVHEWYGNRSESDLVVSLLPSFTSLGKEAAPSASVAEQSSAGDDRGGTKEAEDSTSRKRKWRAESLHKEHATLAELHVHSKRLRWCSRYFDTCMSERWTSAGSSKPAMRLTLEVHTDVKYYKECVSRMYSPFLEIPSVRHCLKLVQVAMQIEFQELVETCVNYLAAVPWSQDDERRIRKFTTGLHYPSDCAADLSARLGPPLSGTERHGFLLDLTEEMLNFNYYSCLCSDFDFHNGERSSSQSWFRDTFLQIMGGSSQALAERVLGFLNDKVKRDISDVEKKGDPHMLELNALRNVRWILKLLLETRTAKEVVEYIVEESSLDYTLSERHFANRWQKEWTDIFLCVLKEVNEGRLCLKTSTRVKLIKNYTWILALGSEIGKGEEIAKILCTFVMTFPYEQQKKMILQDTSLLHPDFKRKLHKHWIRTVQERIIALEQQRSTSSSAGYQYASNFSSPSSVSAFSSTCNKILLAGETGSGAGLDTGYWR